MRTASVNPFKYFNRNTWFNLWPLPVWASFVLVFLEEAAAATKDDDEAVEAEDATKPTRAFFLAHRASFAFAAPIPKKFFAVTFTDDDVDLQRLAGGGWIGVVNAAEVSFAAADVRVESCASPSR